MPAKFRPTRQLVEHLVEAGTLGTIAALPETHKSFLALELAHKIATGGSVLGAHEVLIRGPVSFWWQDDSEANELGRIQEYAGRHDYQGDLPIRWHLNESLRIPDDLDALAAEVEREEQVFVVLDSLYNFLPRLDLKDETVREVLDALKTSVCDPTGATVCIVDHAPWPTEGNRGQRRAYGSVFKGAAIRWGIYLERLPDKLYIEARGNNVRGLTRTLATWDEEALELHLVDVERVNENQLDMRVLEYIADHPGQPTSKVEDGVEGGRESIRKSLERLATHKLLAKGPGRHPNGTYWYPPDHAALVSPGDTQATSGDTLPGMSQSPGVAVSQHPVGVARHLATPWTRRRNEPANRRGPARNPRRSAHPHPPARARPRASGRRRRLPCAPGRCAPWLLPSARSCQRLPRAPRLKHVRRRSGKAVTQRVQSAIRRARGTWRIRDADLRDVAQLLDAGYEPFAVEATRVYLRRRQRDWSAAAVLVVAALAAIVVARWLIVLFLAWLVVA